MSATATATGTGPLMLAASPPAARQSWLQVVSHTDPRYGGLSAAVPTLAASLGATDDLALELAAFCVPGEEIQPAALPADQISFWPTSRAAWLFDRELQASFADAVRGADALHIHGLWEASTAVGCRAARRLGRPYVLSAHGMLEPWALAAKGWKKRLYTALIERANVTGAACLHALTEAEATQYRNFGARGPIAVIPNAVELPEDAHADLFLDRFPELRGRRILLFLSRLHPKKGLDLLVRSWAAVAPRHPEAYLVIAGPDSDGMQARLQAELAAHGVAGQVLFPGMLTGAMKWSALDAAECYVLPSYSEGLSMALLEAMGLGVPVIATHACNMPEITATQAGWEIAATAASLTAALDTVLSRPAEQNWAMGRNGASLVAEQYAPERVTRQMAELYRFVTGGPRPAFVQLAAGGAR